MPVSLANPSQDIVALPPSSYDLPNTVGQDPSSFSPSSLSSKGTAKQEGRIRLTLARDADPSTREQFEASLYGLYRGSSAPTSAPGSGSVTPVQTEPNALYLVDEADGRVLGQLDHAGLGLALEEDAARPAGEDRRPPWVDEHEWRKGQ